MAMTPENKITFYLSLPYAINLFADQCNGEPCLIAEHPELKGCKAQGYTAEEVLRNLKDAREDYITTLIDAEQEVPLPMSRPQVAQVCMNSYYIQYEPMSVCGAVLETEVASFDDVPGFSMTSPVTPADAPKILVAV
jgi:predicted RNase H-like HicB family nuclease